ncbi:MAG: hypothetical protein JJU31_08615 [Wenzhouxiangella sp.]|nr:hypothetical protein [Wenzhouxiangella sp.]TVR94702.1 MAG: hypothetical protein EA418_09495 [Wenzhouxiangellaceae bacterium]
MSAIFGLLSWQERDAGWYRDVLARVSASLARYGGDGFESRLTRRAILARWLLVIKQHDRRDRQPLTENGCFFLFDGRLDNRDDLMAKLDLADRGESLADSELAFAAWVKWREAMPAMLRGDFAFCCWDEQERRLWMARDVFGTRPLYFVRSSDFVGFSSQAKVLQSLPGVARDVSEPELCRFINFLPETGSGSLFRDIQRVRPGHLDCIEPGRFTSRQFFSFSNKRLRLSSAGEYVEAFDEVFGRAVERRLDSFGGVCAQLSSGLDSGAVVAFAAPRLADRGQNLIAYTAVPHPGFSGAVRDGRLADEGAGAASVAERHANVSHQRVHTDVASPMAHFPDMVRQLGRPPLNPCNHGWFDAICQRASAAGMKVMLTGGMGNATISFSSWEILGSLLYAGRWSTLVREIRAGRRPKMQLPKTKLFELLIGPLLPVPVWKRVERRLYPNWNKTDYIAARPSYLSEQYFESATARSRVDRGWQPYLTHRARVLAILSSVDLGDYSASVNQHGLEMRDPTGDLDLVEFLLSLPPDCFMRKGERRWLLKKVLQTRLPAATLASDKRGLQAADWPESFAAGIQDFAAELERLRQNGVANSYIDLDSLVQSLNRWPPPNLTSKSTDIEYRLRFLRGLVVAGFVEYAKDVPGPWC